jgi:hypothetical protein
VWVNEDKGETTLGTLVVKLSRTGRITSDGRTHTKYGSEYVNQSDGIPIDDWRGVRQLCNSYMPLTENWFSAATAYDGDNKTETVLLVDERSFSNERFCSLDLWLIDRQSEAALFDRVGKHMSSEPQFTIVAEVVASLDHFPNHKLALTLRAGERVTP